MVNKTESQSYLNNFLLEHYRNCNSIICNCHVVFQALHKQKVMNETVPHKDSAHMNKNSNMNMNSVKIGEKPALSAMHRTKKLKINKNEKEELPVDHTEKMNAEREK